MSFFRRRVNDRAEAEDLTQDVFIRLLAMSQREEIENVEALVFSIAANLLRDRSRKAIRRKAAQLTDFEAPPVSRFSREFMEDRNPERVLLGRASLADIIRGLEKLGPRTKRIYVLYRLENVKQREIAALYGISQSLVEKEVMRATLYLGLLFGSDD